MKECSLSKLEKNEFIDTINFIKKIGYGKLLELKDSLSKKEIIKIINNVYKNNNIYKEKEIIIGFIIEQYLKLYKEIYEMEKSIRLEYFINSKGLPYNVINETYIKSYYHHESIIWKIKDFDWGGYIEVNNKKFKVNVYFWIDRKKEKSSSTNTLTIEIFHGETEIFTSDMLIGGNYILIFAIKYHKSFFQLLRPAFGLDKNKRYPFHRLTLLFGVALCKLLNKKYIKGFSVNSHPCMYDDGFNGEYDNIYKSINMKLDKNGIYYEEAKYLKIKDFKNSYSNLVQSFTKNFQLYLVKTNKISSINLEIIDICNLKCKICNIWQNKNKNILEINNIKKILQSKHIDKNVDITITGGEPLLYLDIENIFNFISKEGFHISTLSTNGILYTRLEKLLNFCINNNIILPSIHISIDGLENLHDIQRGIKGSFKKSIETIIKLKKNYKKINIKIKYTITGDNIEDIIKVYNLSKKIKINISFKMVENDSFYTNRIKSTKLLDKIDKYKIIKILNKIYQNSDKYINHLIYSMQNNTLNFNCTTPKNTLFIMAKGKVFPCTKYQSIGNIKNDNLNEIIFNKQHQDIINKMGVCNKCFSPHGAYKSLIKN